MKKWRILAIFEFFVPLIFVASTRLFTKWGHDIENCIFAFFVGVLIQCIMGVWGLIGIRKEESMVKERILFIISIVPLFLLVLLYIISMQYSQVRV